MDRNQDETTFQDPDEQVKSMDQVKPQASVFVSFEWNPQHAGTVGVGGRAPYVDTLKQAPY